MLKEGGIKKWIMPAILVTAKSGKLLKVFKVAKFGKIFLTLGTMLISIFAYSLSWGWWFAAGFVIMLFIHEMGHVVALRMKGMKASAPVFIPFLGALIFAPSMGTKEDEAFVGYGGPLLGTVGALAILPFWFLMPSHPPILMTLSFAALFLNLFNLVPVRPFDGGRITQVIGGWFKYFGALAIVGLVLFFRDPGLLLLVMLVLSDWEGIRWLTRSVTMIVCWLAMIGLYAAGLSSGNLTAMLVDVGVGFLFALAGVVHLIRIIRAKRSWESAQYIPVPSQELRRLPDGFSFLWEWTSGERAAWMFASRAYWKYRYLTQGLNTEWESDFTKRMLAATDICSAEDKANAEEVVPPVPFKTRMKWLALYVGLAVGISMVMAWEAGHLQAVIGNK